MKVFVIRPGAHAPDALQP